MEKKNIGIMAGIFVAVCALIFGGISLTRNLGKTSQTISKEEAKASLSKMVSRIKPSIGQEFKSSVEFTAEDTTKNELPDINTCKVVVEPTTDLYAEIFATSEKAGSGTDGWMTKMAESFNKSGYKVNGQPVSIKLRQVSSGQSMDYIYTGAYVPDGYSPSNDLFVSMLNAKGTETKVISDSLVQNTAGIVVKNDVYDKIVQEYGSIDLGTVTEAVADGKLAMGYTNPFTSAAGLNFLACTLQRYDKKNILSEEAVNGFTKFQNNVPFVALTTTQMRTSADKGTLDGFIMEYQTYINDANLSKHYKFVPYGYTHNNPLVATTNDGTKTEILSAFADFCKSKDAQKKASDYGFNQNKNYKCEYDPLSGEELLSAQNVYKENKNNGEPVICVFVADVSGSMEGEPINSLQNALINSMQYVGKDNYVGLVSYNADVTIETPLNKFDLAQQAKFKGSVEHLSAHGSTATFDAICVALDMVNKQLEQTPNAKPLIFVLSDGETNVGYSLKNTSNVISGLTIPVHTIGFNADIDALKKISSITEAATIDASTDDIIYQLKQMFNAEL